MRYFFTFLLQLSIDQVTKFWALSHITVVKNTGISLGLLASTSPLLIIILTLIFLTLLIFIFRKQYQKYP